MRRLVPTIVLVLAGCYSPFALVEPDGEPAGDAVAGDQGGSGDAIAGDPLSGDPMAGDPLAGDPLSGDPMAGDPLAGDPLAGDPLPGDPLAGDPWWGQGDPWWGQGDPWWGQGDRWWGSDCTIVVDNEEMAYLRNTVSTCRDPHIEDCVTVVFTFRSNGRVHEVTSYGLNPAEVQCVMESIAKICFPNFADSTIAIGVGAEC